MRVEARGPCSTGWFGEICKTQNVAATANPGGLPMRQCQLAGWCALAGDCRHGLAWRRQRCGARGGQARIVGVPRAADLALKCAQAGVCRAGEGRRRLAAHAVPAHIAAWERNKEQYSSDEAAGTGPARATSRCSWVGGETSSWSARNQQRAPNPGPAAPLPSLTATHSTARAGKAPVSGAQADGMEPLSLLLARSLRGWVGWGGGWGGGAGNAPCKLG